MAANTCEKTGEEYLSCDMSGPRWLDPKEGAPPPPPGYKTGLWSFLEWVCTHLASSIHFSFFGYSFLISFWQLPVFHLMPSCLDCKSTSKSIRCSPGALHLERSKQTSGQGGWRSFNPWRLPLLSWVLSISQPGSPSSPFILFFTDFLIVILKRKLQLYGALTHILHNSPIGSTQPSGF